MSFTESTRESPRELDETARLLHLVFPIARFSDPRHIAWHYRKNPVGTAVEIDRSDGAERVGHTAGIPQEYHAPSGTRMSVFPLNVAVAASGRGRGLMIEMNEACFEEASRRYGIRMLVAMPNAASTRGYLKLGFRLVRPLPVLLCPPIWPLPARVSSRHVDAEYVESREFDELVATLDLSPGPSWSHRWTPALLRWRLAAPGCRYAVHHSRDAAIVTTVERRAGIPIAVVVKSFRRGSGPEVSLNPTIAGACRFHRAPVALYAGFSAACRVLGAPLPDRFKPAPLNLCVRAARAGDDDSDLVLDTFELFDFDAF